MITSEDIEYIKTKLIKQGKAALDEPFERLATEIYLRFRVRPINFHYDILTHNNHPRLQVIFETSKESKEFFEKNKLFFFDLDKERLLTELFCKIFRENSNYRTDNLYVIFGTFENIANQESNSKIPMEMINDLRTKLNNQDLWEIRKTLLLQFFSFKPKNR